MTQAIWTLHWENEAKKQLKKLDPPIQKRILSFFLHRVLESPNPRQWGKPLVGQLTGYWSFRIGEYRAICEIQDGELTIIVIDVGHRRQVYDM